MKTIRNILCVVEPEPNSEAALSHALRIAENQQASLTFASVTSKRGHLFSAITHDDHETIAKAKREAVEKWLQTHLGGAEFKFELHTGIGFIELIKTVEYNDYDLLIKCSEDAEWADTLFGSDDMHLLRKCPCPVLMLAPGKKDEFSSVLATVDLKSAHDQIDVQSDLNERVIEYATVFSRSTPFNVGSVLELAEEDYLRYSAFLEMPKDEIDRMTEDAKEVYSQRLNELLNTISGRVGKDAWNAFQPKKQLIVGSPQRDIPELAKQCNSDLIVMGTVGRTGIPGFFIGNTAEAILQQVTCSVLAIKPSGFISPVIKS